MLAKWFIQNSCLLKLFIIVLVTLSTAVTVCSEKGIVVGRVQFRDDGDLIDCTRMGVGGKAIPPYIDRITGSTVAILVSFLEPSKKMMHS